MKLTVTWARRTLKAVDELIVYYKEGALWQRDCALCVTVGRYDNGTGIGQVDDLKCSICPWVIFKKERCVNLDYDAYSISLRLRRLYGWRVRLKNIIAKGGTQT